MPDPIHSSINPYRSSSSSESYAPVCQGRAVKLPAAVGVFGILLAICVDPVFVRLAAVFEGLETFPLLTRLIVATGGHLPSVVALLLGVASLGAVLLPRKAGLVVTFSVMALIPASLVAFFILGVYLPLNESVSKLQDEAEQVVHPSGP